MCGICGVLDSPGRDPRGPDPTRAMADALVHRGPDSEGYTRDGRLRFGHRRLEIIDPEGGTQPIQSDDGRIRLVFNGEIFNFRELRRDLTERGHRFRTRSDTEVVLRLYEDRGEELVHDLRGQFAFAVHDARRGRLVLARDRIGIKPLYYHAEDGFPDGGRFLFASELKGILAALADPPPVDETALLDYFTYLCVPAPKTIFRGIRKLEPGHLLIVGDGGLEARRYWDLEFRDEPGDEADLARDVLSELREAVRMRLVADVPLGAFLSGGVDSSAVAALMAGCSDGPIRTFSIGFTEAAFDETRFARQTAERIGSEHHEECVSADPARVLDRIATVFDEPFADSSAIPTYTVSEITRRHVKVALSGDGGDENFAGYRRYYFDALESRLRGWIPAPVRRHGLGPLARVWPKADWLPRPLRAKSLLANLALDADRAYFESRSALPRPLLDRLLDPDVRRRAQAYDAFSVLERHYRRAPRGSLERRLYVDFMTYLPDDILTKVDRASMAHSLEVRVPLLDHRFVERVARIPSRYKLRGRSGKYLFKRALEGIVAPEILHRRKMGFSVPLARWMRDELASPLEAALRDDRLDAYLDRSAIRGMVARHRAGVSDFGTPLYAVLAFALWLDRYGARTSPRPAEATA